MLFLNEKDYGSAPDDPEEKFAYLAERCRQQLYSKIGQGSAAHIDDAIKKQYLSTIRSIAKALNIREIPQSSPRTLDVEFVDMLGTAAGVVSRVRLRSTMPGPSTVVLSVSTRTEIEKKISRLRIYITQSAMPEGKRKELLRKLDELSAALSGRRVSMGTVLILLSSLALGATTFLAESPDALSTVTSVITMIAGEKEAEDVETARLDGPERHLAIEDQSTPDPSRGSVEGEKPDQVGKEK